MKIIITLNLFFLLALSLFVITSCNQIQDLKTADIEMGFVSDIRFVSSLAPDTIVEAHVGGTLLEVIRLVLV